MYGQGLDEVNIPNLQELVNFQIFDPERETNAATDELLKKIKPIIRLSKSVFEELCQPQKE